MSPSSGIRSQVISRFGVRPPAALRTALAMRSIRRTRDSVPASICAATVESTERPFGRKPRCGAGRRYGTSAPLVPPARAEPDRRRVRRAQLGVVADIGANRSSSCKPDRSTHEHFISRAPLNLCASEPAAPGPRHSGGAREPAPPSYPRAKRGAPPRRQGCPSRYEGTSGLVCVMIGVDGDAAVRS